MPKHEEPEFTVTDRRKFTPEGEVRPDVPAEESQEAPAKPPEAAAQSDPAPQVAPASPPPAGKPMPPTPSAEQQQAQHDAFKQSAGKLDSQLQKEMGSRAKEFEMTFERFVASLYMTSLLQLGLMREQGVEAAQVDLLGARQTIDTLGILQEKTKGNLSTAEQNLLDNCLYELRMAYVEVTNVLTKPPAAGGPGSPK